MASFVDTTDLESDITTADTYTDHVAHSWSPNYDEQYLRSQGHGIHEHSYPITNIYLPTDVLVHIFQFFSLRDLHYGRLCRVSTTWLRASLKVEHNRYWTKKGAILVYDNAVFDTVTGDVIYDLNDISISSSIFNSLTNDKQCLTYNNVPFRYQNLDSKRSRGTTLGSSETQPPVRELTNNGRNKETPTPRSHALPVGPADMPNIQYNRMNSAFLYLHDGRYLYILFGNTMACLDLMMNRLKWKASLLDTTPKYLFVNQFTQNSRAVYVAISQNVMSFDKADGYKNELVLSTMINKKKGEVIRDLVVDEELAVIMYSDNIVVDRDIDFSVLNYEGYFREIMSGPAKNDDIVIDEDEEDNTTTNNGALPVSQLATTTHNPGTSQSRKRTLMAMGSLEAPKLYLYDGKNNFIVGAGLKQRDRYRYLKTGRASPVFCVINDHDMEIRVITAQGKRAHLIDLKKECQKLSLDKIEFVPHAGGQRYLIMGNHGGKDWYLIHPESGRVIDLSTHIQATEHDRLFVVETKEGHLKGLVGISTKQVHYYEEEVEKSRMSTESSPITVDQQQQQLVEPDTAITRRLVKRWSVPLQWRTNYYQFELETDQTRFYTSEDGDRFVLTRVVQDSRRFLSAQQRLDIEITVFDASNRGNILWQQIHECYYGGPEAAEKGFDLVVQGNILYAFSFFVPLHTVKKGLSFLTAYNLETGKVSWKYVHKHKPNVMHDILQNMRKSREDSMRKQSIQVDVSSSEGDLTPKGSEKKTALGNKIASASDSSLLYNAPQTPSIHSPSSPQLKPRTEKPKPKKESKCKQQ